MIDKSVTGEERDERREKREREEDKTERQEMEENQTFPWEFWITLVVTMSNVLKVLSKFIYKVYHIVSIEEA